MHWLPPNGALHGVALDRLLAWNLAIILGLCIAAHFLIAAAFLFRRARKSQSPAESQTRAGLRSLLLFEFATLLALTALYIAMDVTGHHLWAATREQPSTSSGTSATPAPTASTAQQDPPSSARPRAIPSASIPPTRTPPTTSSPRSSSFPPTSQSTSHSAPRT